MFEHASGNVSCYYGVSNLNFTKYMLFWLTAWRRKGCILPGGLEHVSGVLRHPWVDGLLELRSMTSKKILLSLWTNSYIYQIPSPLTAISRKKEATLDWKLQSGIPSTGSQAIPSEKTETKPVKLQKLLRQGSVLQSTCTEFHPVALSALWRRFFLFLWVFGGRWDSQNRASAYFFTCK